MSKETVIENDMMSLWYYPESKIVHHKIHKFADEGIVSSGSAQGHSSDSHRTDERAMQILGGEQREALF